MKRRLRFAKNIIALISVAVFSNTEKKVSDTNRANDTPKCYNMTNRAGSSCAAHKASTHKMGIHKPLCATPCNTGATMGRPWLCTGKNSKNNIVPPLCTSRQPCEDCSVLAAIFH